MTITMETNKGHPSILVCITTYQSSETLNSVIDCIFGNYKNSEFCKVDNNSTDNTDAMLDNKKALNIKRVIVLLCGFMDKDPDYHT